MPTFSPSSLAEEQGGSQEIIERLPALQSVFVVKGAVGDEE
jgi:hypothetical protein